MTLHVGAGTFQPVQVESIADHQMHKEWFEVGEAAAIAINKNKSEGGRLIAVGTTSVRTLESACVGGELTPQSGDTQIFIYPGFQFQLIDALVTNFSFAWLDTADVGQRACWNGPDPRSVSAGSCRGISVF